MENYYAEILCSLAAAQVRFVIAGGVAVVLHGVERMTLDVDVALDMEPENVARFVAVMKQLGLAPRVPVPHDFIVDPDNVRRIVEEKNALVFTYIDVSNPLRQVDLFLTREHSFSTLIEDSDTVVLRGETIAIASIPALLRMKRSVQPPRPKDLHDIAELESRLLSGGSDESK